MKFGLKDIILIKGKKYEVLSYIDEVDGYDQKKEEIVGEHLMYELHLIGSNKLSPTHALKVYKDDFEFGYLFKISTEKPNYPKNSRQRGAVINYVNKIKISMDEIERVNNG